MELGLNAPCGISGERHRQYVVADHVDVRILGISQWATRERDGLVFVLVKLVDGGFERSGRSEVGVELADFLLVQPNICELNTQHVRNLPDVGALCANLECLEVRRCMICAFAPLGDCPCPHAA